MKKNIFLWALYDFANSIIMIVFLFYFSQWLVVDSQKPDWWYNVVLVASSLLFIAYFLFSDALLTFANNFPIYLEKVFGATDSVKTYLTAGILTLSCLGSLLFGKMADKKGTKFVLSAILVFWIVFFPTLAFTPSFTMAIVICLVAGLFYGPTWGVSRAMVSEFTPRDIEAQSFSFYTLAERFATFVGPVMWSVVLATTAGSGNTSYSYALTGMGVLAFLGLMIIRKIRLAEKLQT